MRLIDADAMIEDLHSINPIYGYDVKRLEFMVNAQPTADVVERKKGKNISKDGFLCSACGFGDFGGFHGYESNFCPNCGARMEVKTC